MKCPESAGLLLQRSVIMDAQSTEDFSFRSRKFSDEGTRLLSVHRFHLQEKEKERLRSGVRGWDGT